MKFLLRRLAFYAWAALFALTLNFLLPRWLPGDAAGALVARFRGKLSAEALVALQRAYGVARGPLWQDYLHYLNQLAHGDLGVSLTQFPTPVADIVGGALGWTLLVACAALGLSFGLGTLLGARAAWRRGGWLDTVVPPVLSLVGAFPYFWLAMAALFWLGFEHRWFPLRHAYGDSVSPSWTWPFALDVIRHAALPVMTVVLASLGGWMLGMRNAMVAVLGAEYLALGHAKGLSERRLLWQYAARNALLPQVTGFGMALGFVLSGALLTEVVFSYPGLGYQMVQAVRAQDVPLMQGLFLLITLSVLAANLVVDVVVTVLDPRTRAPEAEP